MSEISRIADQLRRAFDGDAWSGPSVFEVLSDVDAGTAAARPIPNAHTIWELTLHLATWEDVVRRRMRGTAVEPSDDENFPKVSDAGGKAWEKAMQLLRSRHEDLLQAVSQLPDARLSEQVPGKDYDFYQMLHGEVQHALYHAGQMALLKKKQG
jgi:uncharacterized damage-inducible protein DinB